MKLFPTSLIAALLAVAAPCCAHHGQDFLLIEDYQQSLPGQVFFISNFEWEDPPGGNEFGFSPSLMIGVLPRLALSVDAEFRNEAYSDWRYNSVTPALHVQLSPAKSTFPVKFAVSGGYQFADSPSEVADEEEDHHHDEHEHEHAEESHHHHGGSIHNHDADAFVGRFIAETDIGKTKIIANLLSVVAEGDKAAWGYAIGARHKIIKEIALGMEALGDFKSDGWQELVAGAYFEPSHMLTLKLGVGFGLTEETPDFTLRTGLTYRF